MNEAQLNSKYLAAIVESSDDAIIGKTLNGIILSWNGGAERLYGYSAEEAVGKSITMLIPPERADDYDAIMDKIAKGQRVEHYETKRITKDGKLLDVSLTVSPIKDDQGVLIGASAIARDITEQQHAETALRRSEEQFRRMVETAPGAILIIDANGKIVRVNERVEMLFGYEPDELVGMSVEALLPDQFRKSHAHYRTDFFAEPGVRMMGIGRDLAGQRKDGTEFPVEIGLSHINTEEGLLAIAFISDITERKRAEEERLSLVIREQAARAEAARTRFEERERISMELHDGIIQSIYAIGMGLEIARTTLATDPKLNELLTGATHDLDGVIDDLRRYILDLKTGLNYSAEFRQQLAELARKFHDSSSARLVIDVPEVFSLLSENSMHAIIQIVREGLSNVARHAKATEVLVQLREAGSQFVLTVKDNGIGFDAETVDRGRGLNNMQSRLQRFNGAVDVQSAPNQGTTLIVRLPVE